MISVAGLSKSFAGKDQKVAAVASIDFDPTAETFATAGASDGLVKLWTTKTQQQFGATFPGDPGQWGNAKYTPDGSKLIVVYQDGTGFVWPVSLPDWEAQACTVAGRNPHWFSTDTPRPFISERVYFPKRCWRGTSGSP